MAWRPAKSLEVLRDEVNARWPHRDKASDGVIGDAAHAASASDHNPNPAGVVCAFDITHDPTNGPDGTYLAELLRTMRHPDLKYVIWSGRIFSAYVRPGYGPFEWRPYAGADPHTNHVHVSVGVGPDGQSQPPYDDVTPWGVDGQGEDDLGANADEIMQNVSDARTDIASTKKDVDSLHVKVDQLTALVDKLVKSGGGNGTVKVTGELTLG